MTKKGWLKDYFKKNYPDGYQGIQLEHSINYLVFTKENKEEKSKEQERIERDRKDISK